LSAAAAVMAAATAVAVGRCQTQHVVKNGGAPWVGQEGGNWGVKFADLRTLPTRVAAAIAVTFGRVLLLTVLLLLCCLFRPAVVLLVQNEEDAYRKMRLRVEDVQGRNCLTNFWVSQLTSTNSKDTTQQQQQHLSSRSRRPQQSQHRVGGLPGTAHTSNRNAERSTL
jgi:hypothetical protein